MAEKIGDPIVDAKQPFAVSPALREDDEYRNALVKLSSLVYHRGLAQRTRTVNPVGNYPLFPQIPYDIKNESAIIAARTGASSLLHVNVWGYRQSLGKVTALHAGSVAIGILTTIATNGMFTYMPRPKGDASQVVANAINLETGDIFWTNATNFRGDPANVDEIADPTRTDKLAYELLHKPAPTELVAK